MREVANNYIYLVFKAGIVIVVFSTLFLFTNLFTEFYDTPKFLILVIFTGILLVLLTLKFTVTGRVILVRTPLDIPLLLLLAVGIVSTVLSPAPYISLLGNQLKIYSSLVALITSILFYYILVNNLKSLKDVRLLIFITLAASSILCVISLLAYSGMRLLPSPWTHGVNFTTTGSNFSSTAILAILLPILISSIFSSSKLLTKSLYALLLTLFGVTIALTGSYATWVAALVGLGLSAFVQREKVKNWRDMSLLFIAIPVIVVALVVGLSFVPPMGSSKNPFYSQAQNFPREIQLSFPVSWKISVSAFRDSPVWGTGIGTYLFNFTNYKPIEFNSTKFWNLRFDSAFNEYLGVLSTMGGIGIIALLSLTAMFVSSALKSLKPYQVLSSSLAISGLVFFVILALHASTLVVWVLGLIILATFMAVNLLEDRIRHDYSASSTSIKQMLMRMTSADASETTVRIDALPSILLIVALALVGTAAFFGTKFALADYHHRIALNAVSQNNGILAYNELVTAEKLNPVNDVYRTDLAQTNFALANAIASAKAPTDASPGGSLTEQDKQNIQILLQQSIDEGRTAVSLSPKSAINWEILASLYRQISGVAQNALIFSLDSYGRAIFQDPLNPLLRLGVGGTYYAIKNYDLAIRFFTDSINLKPDFANGYYNLSVALRDKGDLNSALAAAERLVKLVDQSSQDYKVAQDLLNDLKSKTQTNPSSGNLGAPTAQDTGALQKQELPNVVDVGKPPEKIATPGAVKRPNSTPEPTPIP